MRNEDQVDETFDAGAHDAHDAELATSRGRDVWEEALASVADDASNTGARADAEDVLATGGQEEGRGAAPGDPEDAFEAWMRLKRQMPRPTDEQVAGWLDALERGGEEDVAGATDALVSGFVGWMYSTIRMHPLVPPGALRTPGSLRDDLMGEARVGFLRALQAWRGDRGSAGRDAKGRRTVFMRYSRYWMDSAISAFIGQQQYRMSVSQVSRRMRILKVERELRERTGQRPSDEAIVAELQRRAHERLARKGITNPTQEQLRSAGALGRRSVRRQLAHVVEGVSLTAGEEADGARGGPGAGIAEDVIAAEHGTDDPEARLQEEARRRALEHYAIYNDASATGHVDRERIARYLVGLHDGEQALNAIEVSFVVGRRVDFVERQARSIRLAMRGQELRAAESVRPHGRAQWLARVESALEGRRGRPELALGDEAASGGGAPEGSARRAGAVETLAELRRASSEQTETRPPAVPTSLPSAGTVGARRQEDPDVLRYRAELARRRAATGTADVANPGAPLAHAPGSSSQAAVGRADGAEPARRGDPHAPTAGATEDGARGGAAKTDERTQGARGDVLVDRDPVRRRFLEQVR